MKNAFPTKQAAIEFLESLGFESMTSGRFYMPGTYVTNHGEYERPDFAPRRYGDGWGIHGAYYYYQGTFHAPEDGRIDVEILVNRYAH